MRLQVNVVVSLCEIAVCLSAVEVWSLVLLKSLEVARRNCRCRTLNIEAVGLIGFIGFIELEAEYLSLSMCMLFSCVVGYKTCWQ